jgi:hypothetical protein
MREMEHRRRMLEHFRRQILMMTRRDTENSKNSSTPASLGVSEPPGLVSSFAAANLLDLRVALRRQPLRASRRNRRSTSATSAGSAPHIRFMASACRISCSAIFESYKLRTSAIAAFSSSVSARVVTPSLCVLLAQPLHRQLDRRFRARHRPDMR